MSNTYTTDKLKSFEITVSVRFKPSEESEMADPDENNDLVGKKTWATSSQFGRSKDWELNRTGQWKHQGWSDGKKIMNIEPRRSRKPI